MSTTMWEQTANQKDVPVDYLLRRCLNADGKDPNGAEAMVALIGEVEKDTSTRA